MKLVKTYFHTIQEVITQTWECFKNGTVVCMEEKEKCNCNGKPDRKVDSNVLKITGKSQIENQKKLHSASYIESKFVCKNDCYLIK